MGIQGISGAAGMGNLAANSLQDNLQNETTRAIDALTAGGASPEEQEIEDAALKMESLFASMLVKEMRGSISEGLFGSGPGSDVYNEWFDRHLGDSIASDGGLGMAAMLKVQFGMQAAVEEAAAKAAATEQEAEPGEDSKAGIKATGDQS